jgi:hypothetical protein
MQITNFYNFKNRFYLSAQVWILFWMFFVKIVTLRGNGESIWQLIFVCQLILLSQRSLFRAWCRVEVRRLGDRWFERFALGDDLKRVKQTSFNWFYLFLRIFFLFRLVLCCDTEFSRSSARSSSELWRMRPSCSSRFRHSALFLLRLLLDKRFLLWLSETRVPNTLLYFWQK